MNTQQNTIEKIFLKKNDQNLANPGAKSQVYILKLLHRFANALLFGGIKPFCERGVTRQCVRAVRLHGIRLQCPPFTHSVVRTHCSIQLFNTPALCPPALPSELVS